MKDFFSVAIDTVGIPMGHLATVATNRVLLPLSVEKHTLILAHWLTSPNFLEGLLSNISYRKFF
jgi:hypothetical protein